MHVFVKNIAAAVSQYFSRKHFGHSNCEARTKPLLLKLKPPNSSSYAISSILLPFHFLERKG